MGGKRKEEPHTDTTVNLHLQPQIQADIPLPASSEWNAVSVHLTASGIECTPPENLENLNSRRSTAGPDSGTLLPILSIVGKEPVFQHNSQHPEPTVGSSQHHEATVRDPNLVKDHAPGLYTASGAPEKASQARGTTGPSPFRALSTATDGTRR